MMSFSLTTPQILDHSKTVTRRVGWKFLKAGDLLQAIEKGQGLKKGEHVRKLAVLRVESVRQEPLDDLAHPLRSDAWAEVGREGFTGMSPQEFVEFFAKTHGLRIGRWLPSPFVTRIEFTYVEER
jgi:hypothetical protein